MKVGGEIILKKIPQYPLVGSFDVTNRCTLKCKHCYWWEQTHDKELPEGVFLTKLKEIKKVHPTLISAVWLGGEPLLRKDLVFEAKKLFSFNEVITNGTIPLPDWKEVRFAVSVDGVEKYHELQRGKGCYKKIKKNINRGDLNINIICVITKINEKCLEDFVEEWSKSRVRSLGLAFYTPIKGKDNENIWVSFKERDKIIERIVKLKKKYPDFINTSATILNSFRSENCQAITERCRRDVAPVNSMCFDTNLKRKFPCVIGELADCEKCGCVAAVFGESIKSGDKSFIWEHLKNYFYKV